MTNKEARANMRKVVVAQDYQPTRGYYHGGFTSDGACLVEAEDGQVFLPWAYNVQFVDEFPSEDTK